MMNPLDELCVDESELYASGIFASEYPVQRQLLTGEILTEVLLCGPSNVNLEALRSGLVPVLVDHRLDTQVGVVVSARITPTRELCGVARFSKNSQRSLQEAADIQDEIRCGVSIGYSIDEARFDEATMTLIVTKWTLIELSSVPIPADSNARWVI